MRDFRRHSVRVDSAALPGRSQPGVVDGLLFLLLMSGPPKFRARDITASLRSEVDTAIGVQLVVWSIGFLWVLYRLYPLVIRRRVLPKLEPLHAIGLAFLLSLTFSINRSPSLALTGFVIWQGVVMLAYSWTFLHCYGAETYLRRLFWGYLALSVTIFLAWMFMPSLVVAGGGTRVRGDLIAPSGAVSALALCLLLSGAIRLPRAVVWSIASFLTVMLIVSQTRTAYLGVALFALLSFVFRRDAPIRHVMPLVVALVAVGGLADSLGFAERWIVREDSSLSTLSDRLPLWHYMTRIMLQESPFFGLGYYSASRVLGPQYNPSLGTGHSVFVEVLVGAGLVGGATLLVLYLGLIGYVARLMARARRHSWTFGLVTLFFLVLLFSLTGTEGIHAGPIGFTFWSLTSLLPDVWRDLWMRRRLTTSPPTSGALPQPVDDRAPPLDHVAV